MANETSGAALRRWRSGKELRSPGSTRITTSGGRQVSPVAVRDREGKVDLHGSHRREQSVFLRSKSKTNLCDEEATMRVVPC